LKKFFGEDEAEKFLILDFHQGDCWENAAEKTLGKRKDGEKLADFGEIFWNFGDFADFSKEVSEFAKAGKKS
jgi:hypothetical protein